MKTKTQHRFSFVRKLSYFSLLNLSSYEVIVPQSMCCHVPPNPILFLWFPLFLKSTRSALSVFYLQIRLNMCKLANYTKAAEEHSISDFFSKVKLHLFFLGGLELEVEGTYMYNHYTPTLTFLQPLFTYTNNFLVWSSCYKQVLLVFFWVIFHTICNLFAGKFTFTFTWKAELQIHNLIHYLWLFNKTKTKQLAPFGRLFTCTPTKKWEMNFKCLSQVFQGLLKTSNANLMKRTYDRTFCLLNKICQYTCLIFFSCFAELQINWVMELWISFDSDTLPIYPSAMEHTDQGSLISALICQKMHHLKFSLS